MIRLGIHRYYKLPMDLVASISKNQQEVPIVVDVLVLEVVSGPIVVVVVVAVAVVGQNPCRHRQNLSLSIHIVEL